MKKWFSQLVLFQWLHWRLQGNLDPAIKKCVIIVVPHTSWHDFYIGLLVRSVMRLEINFVGKKELFRFPFGYYFRWLGGAPLDRSGGLNRVEAIAKVFAQRDVFRLAIAPEVTRKKVTTWKTGFYYISLQSKVPIIPVAFDFGKKTITINPPFYPTGDLAVDLKTLEQNYDGVVGKFPEKSFVAQGKSA